MEIYEGGIDKLIWCSQIDSSYVAQASLLIVCEGLKSLSLISNE